MRMPDWIRFPVVLTIVGVISAASLAALNSVTEPKRKALKESQSKEALSFVLPGAAEFKAAGEPAQYYIALDDKGAVTGYAIEGKSPGYGGDIEVMVGVDTHFNITGIKVLSQKETPGLGDKVEEVSSKKTWGTVITGTNPDERGLTPWFQSQFGGSRTPVALKREGGTIEAITGATISSRATVDAVNHAVEGLRSALSK